MKEFKAIWKEIEKNIYDNKNSLIFLLADKYYGKTEMLEYFKKKDQNKYKFLISNSDCKINNSLVRLCFLKLLTVIYKENPQKFLNTIKHKKYFNMKEILMLRALKLDNSTISNRIKIILDKYNIRQLQDIIDTLLTDKVIINYYIGCYQVFEGFNNDIECMNELNSQISFNFIIATRPYSGDMYKYINKFSNVNYFDLIIKKLEPQTYRIIKSNKYYKMPIYGKILTENGIDDTSDIEQIRNAMAGNEYFLDIYDEIGYGVIDSENLLLLSLIMAAGYLSREQIELVFEVINVQKHVLISDLLKQYKFIWDIKGVLFSGSTWGEFVLYNKYNGELKRQLDSFFSTLLYEVFMKISIERIPETIKDLKKLLGTKNNYRFYVDENISDAYQLLLSLAVSFLKHKKMDNQLVSNPANIFAVDFLNKYILTIECDTIDFISLLFDTTQNLNLLLTYGIEIERCIRERKGMEYELIKKIQAFIRKVFSVADSWCDITLLLQGMRCLDAFLNNDMENSIEEYSMNNIRDDIINEIIINNNLDMRCGERIGGAVMNIDVLILIATEDEEKAIIENDYWEIQNELEYSYFYHNEDGVGFALARGINKGATDAAIVAQYFIHNLKPRALAMAGFAAGKLGDVSLGDIVVPYRIFNYDGGKRNGKKNILTEIDDYKIRDKWKQIVERFDESWRQSISVSIPILFENQKVDLLHEFIQKDIVRINEIYNSEKYPDWQELIKRLLSEGYIESELNYQIGITDLGKKYINEFDILHPNGYEEHKPKTRIGIMATGSKVQQWSGIFQELEKRDRNVCALEMEATGIGKISEFKEIPFIIAKGIGDYAKDGKSFDNRFIEYACHSSCRFIIEFFISDQVRKYLGK